jgi:TRAP-type C4-dicarboxylate transport system permease small subunit
MTGHGVGLEGRDDTKERLAINASRSPVAFAARAMDHVNNVIVVLSSIALVLAGLVLSYSVGARYFFNAPNYWQDELAIFLLVGGTFMTTAYVQARRGHIGIEAIVELLPARINRIRSIVVDIASFVFCAFFSWKSWTLFHEAWVDGQVSSSTWAPPLAIPYSIMSLGMTLMSIQIFLQILMAFDAGKRP